MGGSYPFGGGLRATPSLKGWLGATPENLAPFGGGAQPPHM
jgi:hypothetical protein